jgi:glycosyltransferase involved in cell wall biosynthesis
MAEWIISKKPDAVIAHSLAVLYACRFVRKRLPGVKIIAVEHHPNALKSAKRWVLSALAFWMADRVVYLSQAYINEVKAKIGPLFRAAKASLIPNGLDLTEYPLATGAAEGFTVGMQGRFVDAKDFPTLFRAVAVANAQPGQKIRLELAGDGPRREEFEKLVRELGIENEVHFLGMLDHDSLLRHMAKWNVCAHATFGETMSISLMEAKACGLAIVASDANGVSPWFRNGVDGILTPVQDHEAMGRALRQLANDPALCHRLGTEALADAQRNYSSTRAWGAYRKLVTGETAAVPERAVCVS